MSDSENSTARINPPTTTNNNSSNVCRNNNRSGGGGQGLLSNPVSYEGECAKVGGVMGLRTERFTKKVSYQVFIEKISGYIVKKHTENS